jgi:GntR family transcriptional regulator, transcriptional repressor for pyruvate dehydrogenase complex
MIQPTAAKEKHSGRSRNGSSSEQVLNHLRELIQQGKLKPGERLPAERDLADLLQVSRPTLRAGLRSLAAIGVLESRHGSGTYVVDVDGPPVLDASPLRLMAALRGFTSEEMFEARLALETTAAGLAAERATSDELATLAEELAGIFASVDDPDEFLVHDVEFHRGIATASHNRILAALSEMVVTAMYDARKSTVRGAQDLKESAEWHRRTYRAIREHKIEEARDTMREHLVRARVAQQQETVPRENKAFREQNH